MSVKTKKQINPAQLMKVAEVLKCISHPARLQILELLEYNKSLTVSELMDVTQIEQSLLSHHLNKMKDKGVLKSERDGKNILYSLSDRSIVKIFDCLDGFYL